MKQVIQFLKRLGLSDTEVKLYLHGLRHQNSSVAALVKAAGIKRTTAYHALATLVEKGMAAESKQDGRLYYHMTPATELSKTLEKRREKLDSQRQELDQLTSQFPTPTAKTNRLPEAGNYYGIDGVQAAIDRALYCQNRSWRIVSPRDNYFHNSTADYIEYFKNKRTERSITARSLWESPDGYEHAVTNDDIQKRQPRQMPASMVGKFKSSVILFDDQMLIISSFREQFATLITSAETVASFSVMFDALWDASPPINSKA